MKLGCICGSFNRAFDARTMDQMGFLRHCATTLGVRGVEHYDGWISFEYEAAEAEATGIPRVLAYLRRLVALG